MNSRSAACMKRDRSWKHTQRSTGHATSAASMAAPALSVDATPQTIYAACEQYIGISGLKTATAMERTNAPARMKRLAAVLLCMVALAAQADEQDSDGAVVITGDAAPAPRPPPTPAWW